MWPGVVDRSAVKLRGTRLWAKESTGMTLSRMDAGIKYRRNTLKKSDIRRQSGQDYGMLRPKLDVRCTNKL